MGIDGLIKDAKEKFGFTEAGVLNTASLEFMPEVRDMCAADRCRSYNRCWTCPPACGTIEEISKKARKYTGGIIVQSVGQMEDEFDVEVMMETEQLQKERFYKLVDYIKKENPDCLPMSAGTCTICKKCSYPDAPCRFPDKAYPSMEAYGLFVSKVCEQSGVKYYYGKNTITYTSCILLGTDHGGDE